MLSLIGRVNAARVDPEVLQSIMPCLLSTEDDFLVAWLSPATVCLEVYKRHLVFIRSPGV